MQKEIKGGLSIFHESLDNLKQKESELKNILTYMQVRYSSVQLQ